jgi:hypothetical protein
MESGIYGADYPPLELEPQHEHLSDIGPRMLLSYGEINMHIMENLRPLIVLNFLATFMSALLLYKVKNLV